MRLFFSDNGIVLRKFNVGEKDQMVRVLTRSVGKRVFMAKGVRSPSSKKCGAVDVGQQVSLSSRSSKSGMWYLDQVKLERSSRELIRDSWDDLFGLLGFIDMVLGDEQHVEGVYDLAAQALADLGIHEEVLVIFQVKLLSLLGFVPALDRCSVCGNRLDLSCSLGADIEHGGFVCCLALSSPVDFRLVKILSFFQKAAWQDCLRLEVDGVLRAGMIAQMRPFLNGFSSARI